MRKQVIRRQLLKSRESIPAESVKNLSRLITDKITSLPEFRVAKIVHCYLSIAGRNEVETDTLIQFLKNSDKRIVVPKIVSGSDKLIHLEVDENSLFETNSLGIPEPSNGMEVDVRDMDLVIVPMVGADRNKNRLGYGKGFYDRFLAETDAVKTGIVFERFLLDEPLPVESFDIPVDILVTENEIIR